MRVPEESNRELLRCLYKSIEEDAPPHFSEFSEVCETFVKSYARFARAGDPGAAVALAMLGASLNVFSSFANRHMLPKLLRRLADKIEIEEGVHQARK